MTLDLVGQLNGYTTARWSNRYRGIGCVEEIVFLWYEALRQDDPAPFLIIFIVAFSGHRSVCRLAGPEAIGF